MTAKMSALPQRFSLGEPPCLPTPLGTSPDGSPVLLDGSPSAMGIQGRSPRLNLCDWSDLSGAEKF